MVSRSTKFGVAGLGGSGILIALNGGAEPATALLAGFLASTGGFDPSLADAVSIVGNSIPAAGFASTSLDLQPLFEALPMWLLEPVVVAIVILSVVGIYTEATDDE